MDLGIIPGDEPSVVPNLRGGLQHTAIITFIPRVTVEACGHLISRNEGSTMRKLPMVVSAALILLSAGRAEVKTLSPGWNLFSPQQDIQLGREAAAEVEKKMPVAHNRELDEY